MKKRTNIIRFFGLFMLVAVLLNSITPARAMVKKQLDSQQSAKKATNSSSTQDDEHATFSESSSDVVMPSHAFSFDNDFIVVPTPEFNFIFSEKAAFKPSEQLYRHSYFDKLYEHHIAINAP